uniref:Candidate secreted effector n=1 Tax=Meloidogyne incognita TaxID=6306 RepID=A0A914KVR4_MELIC
MPKIAFLIGDFFATDFFGDLPFFADFALGLTVFLAAGGEGATTAGVGAAAGFAAAGLAFAGAAFFPETFFFGVAFLTAGFFTPAVFALAFFGETDFETILIAFPSPRIKDPAAPIPFVCLREPV